MNRTTSRLAVSRRFPTAVAVALPLGIARRPFRYALATLAVVTALAWCSTLAAATLTAHWALDEGSGQTVGDSAGTANGSRGVNTGASTDDPTWSTAAKIGSHALTFDGSDWVNFGDVLDQGASGFTTSLWANMSPTASTTSGRLFQKRGTGMFGTVPGWIIAARRNGTSVEIENTIWDDGAGNDFFISTNTSGDSPPFAVGSVGEWIHLVSVFDQSANRWTWYADGAMVKNFTINSSLGSVDNNRPLSFGAASDPGTSQFYSGLLDDVGLFSGALTEPQVKAIYTLADSTDPFGNGADLNYDLSEAQSLFALFGSGSGSTTVDGLRWSFASGLTTALGELTKIDGVYFLRLAQDGTGVSTQVHVPEPTTGLLLVVGLIAACGSRRLRRRNSC